MPCDAIWGGLLQARHESSVLQEFTNYKQSLGFNQQGVKGGSGEERTRPWENCGTPAAASD
jgi:hypothetical protein